MKGTIGLRWLGVLIMVIVFFLGLAAKTEAEPPIKLGVNSEWDWVAGQAVKKGAEMAIRDINAAGGLLGRQVEGIYYDNKCNTEEGKKATERLLYRDKVDAVCGYWRSDVAIASQPLVMEAKKMLLIAGAATPVLTYENIAKDYKTYKYTFSAQPNSVYLGFSQFQLPVSLAKDKLGLSKLAIISEKSAWFEPIQELLLKSFKDIIVYTARISPDATDFSVEFSQAKAAGANLLCFVNSGKGQLVGVKQWHDMQLPMLMVGFTMAAMDPKFMETTEGKGEGVEVFHYIGSMGFPITSKSKNLYEAYNQMFGEYPRVQNSAMAYDIIRAWAEGVKLAGTVDSDAVVKAMESPKFYYEGWISVLERFDKVHNPVGGGWKEGEAWGSVLTQWQKGKMTVIWPDKHKTGDISIPERVKKLMGR